MPDSILDPKVILAQFVTGPDQLEAVLADLSTADLDLAPDPDSWSIRQIAHHIVDGDDLWKVAIKAALGNPNTRFSMQWYWELPQNDWAKAWCYNGRSVELSLALFRANRRHIIQLVETIPDAWERSIHILWPHEPEERVSVGRMIEMQAGHAAGHIDDIRTIRTSHGR